MKHNDENEERMNILKAKEGDSSAFEYLVRKYHRPIYHLCLGFTGAHQSADDLSQDTFIKAFFSLGRFDVDRGFYAWIRKIAVNSSLNYIKKNKREKPLDSDHPNSSASNSPSEQLQWKRFHAKFHDAFHTLPEDQKSVFILRTYENLSYEEIADILEIPPGTVMSRLSRARNKLKSEMAEYL